MNLADSIADCETNTDGHLLSKENVWAVQDGYNVYKAILSYFPYRIDGHWDATNVCFFSFGCI